MDFKAVISGTQYKMANTYQITEQAGSVSQSTVDILVEVGQSIPTTLQDVTILDENDDPFFWGIIQNVTSPTFSSTYEVKRYRLDIASGEVIFNNRLVSEALDGKYTHQIVQVLFDNYIADEGITLGFISTSTQYYKNYNCQWSKLSDILEELSEDIDATYYIGANKQFFFVTRENFTPSLTPNLSNVSYEENIGDLRTVQIIAGATEETSEQSEVTTWPANQSTWLLGYQVSEIQSITINGATATFGVRGIDDDNTNTTFLYEFGSQTITVNSNATTKPVAGNLVAIIYKGYYNIVVTNINDQLLSQISSLNGTSGKIENVVDDETITTFTDADTKATSLLNQYNERERELSCICQDLEKSKLFNIWSLDLQNINISGDYVVCERSISDFGDKVLINVKLKSKNFYSKYGTVLKRETKQVGKDVKVYKQSAISDTINITESYQFNSAGIIIYPTISDFIDPNGFDLYPL